MPELASARAQFRKAHIISARVVIKLYGATLSEIRSIPISFYMGVPHPRKVARMGGGGGGGGGEEDWGTHGKHNADMGYNPDLLETVLH